MGKKLELYVFYVTQGYMLSISLKEVAKIRLAVKTTIRTVCLFLVKTRTVSFPTPHLGPTFNDLPHRSPSTLPTENCPDVGVGLHPATAIDPKKNIKEKVELLL